MSYILDALRRADSERDRGAVPNLFAQPLPRVSIDPGAADVNGNLVRIAGGAVLVVLIGIAAWRLTAPNPPPVVAQVTPAPTPPAAVAVAPSVTQPPMATAPMAARPAADVPRPVPTQPVRPVRKPPAAAVASTSPPTAAASSAEARIYARNELPSEVQRELPNLAIGGASYSESAANRMLIINGQVFHEGDKLAPELVLEQIKLKSAVLRYKGYRYGVSY